MTNWFKYLLYLVLAVVVSSARAGAYEDFFRGIELDRPIMVSDLLAQGFDPNAANEKGLSGLYLALRGESFKAFDALMAHPGLKVDVANEVGETPLMMAALRGSADACRRLIERGAQVNRPGWSPLHYAATGPEPQTVKLLLDRGADVDAPSPNGSTALMMAARYGAEDSVFVLLEHKADAQLRNQQNMTAADFARSAGRDKLAARIEKFKR